MPPQLYLLTHPAAQLTEAEKRQLIEGLAGVVEIAGVVGPDLTGSGLLPAPRGPRSRF